MKNRHGGKRPGAGRPEGEKTKVVRIPMDQPYLYFLFSNKKLIYIGQTSHIKRRLREHKRDKSFDYYRLIPCSKKTILDYERRLIAYFRPPLNGEHGGSRPGSGRPKKKKSEKKRSKVIRVPLDKLKAVKDLLKSAVASKGREKHVRGGCIDRTRKKDQVCCYPVGTCDDCQIP